MNDDLNDTQLDAALEALARQAPPADHVAQVLTLTSGRDASPGRAGRSGRAGSPPWRAVAAGVGGSRPSPLDWALATAAALLVAVGVTWQVARMPVQLPDVVMARWDPPSLLGSGVPGGRPYPRLDPQLDPPVLPPQAYWGMDAFTEFETLRPARLAASRPGHAGGSSARAARPSGVIHGTSADDELAWVPMPTGLAPIELPSIVPAPLVVAPLAPLEDIALAEIPVEPIAIAPLIEEERP